MLGKLLCGSVLRWNNAFQVAVQYSPAVDCLYPKAVVLRNDFFIRAAEHVVFGIVDILSQSAVQNGVALSHAVTGEVHIINPLSAGVENMKLAICQTCNDYVNFDINFGVFRFGQQFVVLCQGIADCLAGFNGGNGVFRIRQPFAFNNFYGMGAKFRYKNNTQYQDDNNCFFHDKKILKLIYISD